VVFAIALFTTLLSALYPLFRAGATQLISAELKDKNDDIKALLILVLFGAAFRLRYYCLPISPDFRFNRQQR